MQGGLHPDLKIEWCEDLFRSIKALPDSSALPVGARGDEHRGSERPEPAGHHPAAHGFGPGFDSGRGAEIPGIEDLLRRIIRDAGFVPKQRDTLYRTYFLN